MSRKKLNLKMRSAFSLIELIITLAISSILFGALMSFLYSIQKSASSYYKFVADDRVVNIGNYLFRDFSGAFIPTHNPDDKNFQDKEKRQLIKDCFECKTDAEGRLKEIKFITNNYLPIYNGNMSRVNRVIYKLELDNYLFKLMRSKDYNLEDSNFDTFYTMLDQIKDCKIKLFQMVKNDNGESEVNTQTNWSANKIYQERDQKNKQLALLPQQIVFTITLQSEKTFEFLVPIFGYFIDIDNDTKAQAKKQGQQLDDKSNPKQKDKEQSNLNAQFSQEKTLADKNNELEFPGLASTTGVNQLVNKFDDQMTGLFDDKP